MSGQEEKKYSQKEVDELIDQKLKEKASEIAKKGVAAWISKEKAGGQSNADSEKTDRQKAEEAIKKQSTIEAIKANTAIAQIKNESERKLVEDSYDNWFTNAGIYNFSQAVHSRFMGYAFLSYLSQDAMINNGVTVMSDELTRKWGEVINPTQEADDANISVLNDLISELNTKHRFREAAIATGFFGGCLMYIDIRDENGMPPDDAELETPLYIDGKDELNKSKLLNKKIVGLKVIEPINISPAEYNSTDPKAQDFYQPQHFFVLGQKIHRSRFLYFADILPPMILKPVYMFFGIPLAQLAFEYVQDFYTNKQAISKIIKKFSLTAFKTDTQKLLQGENGACGVEDRVATLAKYRDNDSVLILDINEEELEQINTPLTGLKEIWYANLELIPMIFKTPAPKLLQIAPSTGNALNSSGEFEMRSFYDSVNTKQNTLFGEPMQRLINILCHTKGIDPKGYAFNWVSLYEMSEKEIAELNKSAAETDRTLWEIGAINNQDVAKRLSKDEKSGHNGIEIPEVIDPNALEKGVDDLDNEETSAGGEGDGGEEGKEKGDDNGGSQE